MKKLLAVTLILLLVFVAGCVKPSEAPAAPEAAVDTAISEDVSNVDTLSDDLSTSELDNLDKDLAEVTW